MFLEPMATPACTSIFYTLLLFTSLAPNTLAQCFNRRAGVITLRSNMKACNNTESHPGGVQQCCNDFEGGTCGTDRLCKNADGAYYVGGCTDSTYRDPVCRSECTWYPSNTAWVEWVAEEKQWHCCGDVTDGCNGSLEAETFNAVAPNLWVAASATSSAAASTSSTVPTENSLGQGAAIGVGVGAAIGGMAVLGATAWVFRYLRRRKLARSATAMGFVAGAGGPQDDAKGVDAVALLPYRREMAAAAEPKELHGGEYVGELPAGK